MINPAILEPKEFKRRKDFAFQHPGLGQARFLIAEIESTRLLGSEIGKSIVNSFKNGQPAYEALLFGDSMSGKSKIANWMFKEFKGSDGKSLNPQTSMERFSDTFPQCLHIDYWRHEGLHKLMYRGWNRRDNEFLLAEWSERMPSQAIHPDRIEIEMLNCNEIEDAWKRLSFISTFDKSLERWRSSGNIRIASIIGNGNGIEIVESIKSSECLKSLWT